MDDGSNAPNVLSLTRVNHSVRSTDLTTKREAARIFVTEPAVHVIAVAASVLAGGRVWAGLFDRGDIAAAIVTVATIVAAERVVHHRATDTRNPALRWNRLAALTSARRHHQQTPTEIRWLMLSGVEAAAAVLVLGGIVALWAAPLGWSLGASVPGTVLTAWACAVLGLGHVQWVHLLSHSSYRPSTRFYARLAHVHRQRHHVDEHRRIGAAVPTGDATLVPRQAAPGPITTTGPAARSAISTLSLH